MYKRQDVGGAQQLLADGAAQLGDIDIQSLGVVQQHLAHQGEAVGVDAVGDVYKRQSGVSIRPK